MNKPEPIPIRGVIYPKATDAAKALGVTKQAVYAARKRGRLDYLGLGPGKTYPGDRKGRPTIPIIYETDDGARYFFESATEAAKTLGCSRAHIYRLIRSGKARRAIPTDPPKET